MTGVSNTFVRLDTGGVSTIYSLPMPAYRVLGVTLLPLFHWRITEITGLEYLPHDAGYILAANHQSWIDSAILAGAVYHQLNRSLRFVAQSSKYRLFGGIPINE